MHGEDIGFEICLGFESNLPADSPALPSGPRRAPARTQGPDLVPTRRRSFHKSGQHPPQSRRIELLDGANREVRLVISE